MSGFGDRLVLSIDRSEPQIVLGCGHFIINQSINQSLSQSFILTRYIDKINKIFDNYSYNIIFYKITKIVRAL